MHTAAGRRAATQKGLQAEIDDAQADQVEKDNMLQQVRKPALKYDSLTEKYSN